MVTVVCVTLSGPSTSVAMSQLLPALAVAHLDTTTDCLKRRSSSYVRQNPILAISVISSDDPHTLSIVAVTARGIGMIDDQGRNAWTMV